LLDSVQIGWTLVCCCRCRWSMHLWRGRPWRRDQITLRGSLSDVDDEASWAPLCSLCIMQPSSLGTRPRTRDCTRARKLLRKTSVFRCF